MISLTNPETHGSSAVAPRFAVWAVFGTPSPPKILQNEPKKPFRINKHTSRMTKNEPK